MIEHYLYLNKAELVLFPPISLHDSKPPSVVQVIIKASRFATPSLPVTHEASAQLEQTSTIISRARYILPVPERDNSRWFKYLPD